MFLGVATLGVSRLDVGALYGAQFNNAGFTLTDSTNAPARYIIPPGFSLAPGAFLLVWADQQPEQTRTGADLHANFKLGQDGEYLALHDALESFERGTLLVNVVDLPIKCPVAPLEFCFLADWYFTERGIRDQVDIVYATPLDGAFTKPVASAKLKALLEEKGVNLVTEFNTGEVDGVGRKLISYDGREVPFDLAVVVPLHSGAEYVGRSEGLGDDLNFVPVDKGTLQTHAKRNIFAIGDATNVPASKAGSVTHFEGEVLCENIIRFLDGRELANHFDGHANCFIETGFGKALLIDFNYETEPLPGHFPGKVGMPLLKESRMNHLGKLMFQWFYWHALLQGRDIPGIGADMPAEGKDYQVSPAHQEAHT